MIERGELLAALDDVEEAARSRDNNLRIMDMLAGREVQDRAAPVPVDTPALRAMSADDLAARLAEALAEMDAARAME